MNESSTLVTVLKRDRVIVLLGLVAVTLLGWVYLVVMAAGMPMSMAENMAESMAPALEPWTPIDFVAMFLMWSIMMIAMMVPSAAPMILLFANVFRQQDRARPFGPTAAFTTGYLLAWTLFSLAATVLQWALEQVALLSPMMMSTSHYLGAGLLIAAGIYQLTPLKDACLAHCRSPVQFMMTHWRTGVGGALRMGLEHGLYCIGCCWFLMGLLFVGGVMNLLWVAAIAAFVLLEKVLPWPRVVAWGGGVLMLVAGALIGLRG